jgi:hypothetical protein
MLASAGAVGATDQYKAAHLATGIDSQRAAKARRVQLLHCSAANAALRSVRTIMEANAWIGTHGSWN